MDCPKCNAEMMICGFDYTAVGDDNPETPTRLYHTAICECRNPDCSLKGVKFNAGATELPKPQALRRFCQGCGALLAEIADTVVLPDAVQAKSIALGGDIHITCPVCSKEDVITQKAE